MSESRNLKIHEGTTLLLFSQASIFVSERISALQSQVSCQYVETWRRAGIIWTMPHRHGNAGLGGMAGRDKR